MSKNLENSMIAILKKILIFGFFWFMVMHALWNLAALEILSLKVSLLIWTIFMIASLGFVYFRYVKGERV